MFFFFFVVSVFHLCSKFYVLLTKSVFWEVWPRQIWFQQMCFSLLSLTSKSVTALNNNEARKPLSVWICSCGKLLTVHRSCTTSTGAWKLLPARGGGVRGVGRYLSLGRWAADLMRSLVYRGARWLFVPCCHSLRASSPIHRLLRLSITPSSTTSIGSWGIGGGGDT